MAVSVKITGGEAWKKALEPYADGEKIELQAGIFEESTYPDGLSVATIAAAHEFGTANIPARSFLRSTLVKKAGEWSNDLAALLKANPGEIKKSLETLGDVIVADISQTIEDGISPALEPETVEAKRRRGKNNKTVNIKRNKGVSNPELPLVDTGTMQRAIESKVVKS